MYEQHIRDITANVWQSVLGLHIEEAAHAGERGPPTLMAWVQISGAWRGAVVIECSQALVRRCGALMFGIPPEELVAAELADAIGELANIVGGNFKALMPGECTLSLPSVVQGSTEELTMAGHGPARLLTFACLGEPMTIAVLEHGE